MEPQRSIVLPITIAVLVSAVVFGGGAYYLGKNGLGNSTPNANPTITPTLYNAPKDVKWNVSYVTPTPTTNPTANWATFSNATYHFSFKYPQEWASTLNVQTQNIKFGDEINGTLLKVSVKDPVEDKKIQCVNNQNTAQYQTPPATITPECVPVLNGLSDTAKNQLVGPNLPPDIFVRVIPNDPSLNLHDWLMKQYHNPDSELYNYSPGKQITLDGVSGLASQIGCCAGYDFSYVVVKGNYIFELGTNDRKTGTGSSRADEDNTLIQKVATTFKFTQ